jgi:gliding motility-associated protein GldM
MGGGKQTPRQAMIGMMYLVLLAMLAMNASKDLLNAFVFLDNGINETVKSFDQANSAFYSTIDKAAAGSASYKPVQVQANKIKQKAAQVVQMMADHKVVLYSGMSEKFKTTADTSDSPEYRALFENGIPLNKDNQDIGGGFYVPGGIPSEPAVALKKAVDDFRDLVIETLNTDQDLDNDYLVEKYKVLFNTEVGPNPLEPGGPEVTWASKLSEHIPLAAVTANLTLWQSYIKNAEADVVGSIASKMDGSGMVVDKSKGVVQFTNGYVLKNDTVKASMFLAAYSSKADPKIYIGIVDSAKFKKGSNQLKIGPGISSEPPMIGEFALVDNIVNGAGKYSTLAKEVGAQTITGVIENKSSKGTFYTKFKSSYMVAEPSATVAATKMSVFYVGVSNPVSVSAPGIAISDIEVSAPGLVFKNDKKAGNYTVSPRKATNKKGLDVVVKNKITKAILGKANFRVKRLPDPAASVLGSKEGIISRGKLKVIQRVDAKMENFDFDLSVSVKQFTLTVKVGSDLMSFKSKNNKLTPSMKKVLKKVGRGSRIYFEEIKVAMPGGPRKVPSLIFKVQ